MSNRMDKYYVVKDGTRMCGIRYDRKKEEVMVCGPDSRRGFMHKILTMLVGVNKATSVFTQTSRPCVAKLRIMCKAVINDTWEKGLYKVLDSEDLDLAITDSFRRTCR